MADRLSPSHRSWNMGRIRGRDTAPERIVRSALHALGYRFRLHRSDLPGRPDVVMPGLNLVILIHGCFWHRHPGCAYSYTPKTRVSFWETKFRQNVERDIRNWEGLIDLGWNVMVLWECEIADTESFRTELSKMVAVHSIG